MSLGNHYESNEETCSEELRYVRILGGLILFFAPIWGFLFLDWLMKVLY